MLNSVSTFEYTNEVRSPRSGQMRSRKPRGGKVEPFREKMNGNNNNAKFKDDCIYIADKLQGIIDSDGDELERLSGSLTGGVSTRSSFRMGNREKMHNPISPGSKLEKFQSNDSLNPK